MLNQEINMNGTLLLIVLVVAAILVMIFVPRWLMTRAFSRVVQIFREHNAIEEKNARTIDELGLRPPTFVERLSRFRDYKPQALDLLRKADIVQMTEGGKLYLSEDRLASSRLRQR